ncbi:DUF5689 domain-containing protein [Desertivirga xinjiangensis]|uniref:DUF5689 domain-containing protein n=1 Tax=Desertivirga xinjiangensis TaxID=539206 RepID=UPI002108D540|nr:DUF5689 domain-containing protein [Pedobacter xinjiangensis]
MFNKVNYLFLFMLWVSTIVSCKKNDSGDPEPKPEPVQVLSISIDELKKLSTAASVDVPDGKKIKGIVISDASAKNIDSKTLVLQEATDKQGILINFDAAHTFALGDEVEIDISKKTLAQVNGEVMLQNIPVANAKKTGTGTVTPRATTIEEINTNKVTWNGTLVSIGGGMFTGSGRYAGTLSYGIDNGSIKSVVASGAAFENTDYPALTGGLTGIVRISGNEVFLNIRNAADVKSSESFVIVDDFSGAEPNHYVQITTSNIYPRKVMTNATKQFPNAADLFPFSQSANGWTFANASHNRVKVAEATDEDEGFLTPGRNYFWSVPALTTTLANRPTAVYNTSFNFFRGTKLGGDDADRYKLLKNITVVVAGSKTGPGFWNSDLYKDYSEFTAFDAANDGFKVKLMSKGTTVLDASPVFNDQGIWHTVTFKDVNTKVAAYDTEQGSYRSDFYLDIESLRRRATVTRGSTSMVAGNPVVIDRIILEFSEKPDWAN